MAKSVQLKLEEYDNDDDASKALADVSRDLDTIASYMEDGEYNDASADLDDLINKLQGVKNYIDTKLE